MKESETQERFMRMALLLAAKGRGKVNPNPLVGAVVVKKGIVVGKGYHPFYGGTHAEIVAMEEAGEHCHGADLYVSLEPCSHQGKTPPCAGAIISSGIKRVYVPTLDPNPLVKGKGVRKLIKSGVEVVTGVCEKEARGVNKIFFKYMETGKAFVSIKMGITLDGFIADSRGRSRWITSPPSRRHVHMLRAMHDAVLVGPNTIKADDPMLNVRLRGNFRQPKRVLIDPDEKDLTGSRILTDPGGGDLIIFKCRGRQKKYPGAASAYNIDVITLPGPDLSPQSIIERLSERGITSVLVEGGAGIFSRFTKERAVDRLYIFIAGKFFGRGLSPLQGNLGLGVDSPYSISIEKTKKIGDDLLIEGIPKWE